MTRKNETVTIMHNGVPTEVTVLEIENGIVHTDVGDYERGMFEVLIDGVVRYKGMYGKKDNKKIP